jgi:hypothetical protein
VCSRFFKVFQDLSRVSKGFQCFSRYLKGFQCFSMFEGDSADMCAGKFLLVLIGGQAEGLACADPEARTTIGTSRILLYSFSRRYNQNGFRMAQKFSMGS